MGSVGPTVQCRIVEQSPASAPRENAYATFLSDFWRCSADNGELHQLYRVASKVEFAPGQTIFSEADRAASVFGILKGCVRLYRRLLDGRRHIVDFARLGDFLGMPFEDRHSCSAEAIDHVVLCRFRQAEFARFVQSSPNTMLRLIDFAASQLDRARHLAMLLGHGSAEERLATFLIEWRNRLGLSSSTFVPLPMMRRDIADLLGLKQETLSRALARLEAKNAIRIVPQGVVLLGLDTPFGPHEVA